MLCRSGSDKRIASDSLYDDQRRFGFRVVRGGRFPAYSSRAGSLETCGFKQTFWSLLGLRPKVTRARSAEYSRRRHERNEQRAAGGIEKKVVGPLRPKVTRARERGIFPPEGAIQAPPVADTAR